MSIISSIDAKVVVLGSQGVGKTSVVVRYVGNTFNKHVSPTIGASFFTCKMSVDGFRMKLQVWDTAGQERFRAMAPMYYRKANAALLVYDITSSDSFDDMKAWVKELLKNVDIRLVLVVLGNKSDLQEEREVPLNDALEYASSIGAKYFETSALSNLGIDDVFLYVAHSLIKVHEQGTHSDMLDSDTFAIHDNADGSSYTSSSSDAYKSNNMKCCINT